MTYFTRKSVEGKIPPEFLLDALDDNRDGVEDPGIYDAVAENACTAVDAFLGSRWPVPFPAGSVPPLARQAALVFALEELYQRRGWSENTSPPNPWSAQANALRTRLGRISAGEEPLRPDGDGVPVGTVTEPSRTTSKAGRMAL